MENATVVLFVPASATAAIQTSQIGRMFLVLSKYCITISEFLVIFIWICLHKKRPTEEWKRTIEIAWRKFQNVYPCFFFFPLEQNVEENNDYCLFKESMKILYIFIISGYLCKESIYVKKVWRYAFLLLVTTRQKWFLNKKRN